MKNMNSLMAAYFAVWAVFFVYEFTVSKRLARLRDEVQRLKEAQRH
jgi:CcmD family protein